MAVLRNLRTLILAHGEAAKISLKNSSLILTGPQNHKLEIKTTTKISGRGLAEKENNSDHLNLSEKL